MRSSFAKSIYVGAAVLGLAGLSAVTTTTASAKSYATASSYTALTKGQNVLVNGTNAIYSKPGTVKGAKVVASKKTVAKLAASKKSNDTFYAYGTKTTNRGSVYYKIVTMDKKYRGYIYGGKTAGTFAGGIKTTDTLTTAATPARTTGYYLKDASKNTLWTAPKYTDINAKKVSLYGAAKSDPFTVDKAATKTKEGSLYYHVTDSNNSAISGWIYAGKGYDTTITDSTKQDLGGLSLSASDAAATENNSVKINYIAKNGNTVATSTFVTKENGTKAGQSVANTTNNNGKTLAEVAKADVPSGYTLTADPVVTTNAVYGGTLNVDVYKSATSTITFWTKATGVSAGTEIKTSEFVNGKPAITTAQAKSLTGDVTEDAPSLDHFFTASIQSVTKTATDSMSVQKSDTDPTPVNIDKGAEYHVLYTYDKDASAAANKGAKKGDPLKAVFAQVNVQGKATASTDNSNTTSNY
ncbi:S-layer protein [Levilactobacillus brevis]|uniref:S-layer protein n=1 Tax=Levilactobacillus brevis TaxID=1580 RepID=UPI0021A8FEB1|nr:S-layer protein [Levilactobacillus brevis]MCT3574542.1 S-layer protein [Levilactobacillus brevis]